MYIYCMVVSATPGFMVYAFVRQSENDKSLQYIFKV